MQYPTNQFNNAPFSAVKTMCIVAGSILVCFAVVAAAMLLFGVYAMFKSPEQFGLLQTVLDSIKAADTLFTFDANGQQQGAVHLAPAPLYITLLLVLGLIIKVVASMAGVFGNLGMGLLRIGLEKPAAEQCHNNTVAPHSISRPSPGNNPKV